MLCVFQRFSFTLASLGVCVCVCMCGFKLYMFYQYFTPEYRRIFLSNSGGTLCVVYIFLRFSFTPGVRV